MSFTMPMPRLDTKQVTEFGCLCQRLNVVPAEVPQSDSPWRPAAECSDSVQGEKERDDPAEASPSSVYEWPSVDLDPEKASSTSSRRRRKNKTTVQADDQDPTKQSSPISPSAKQKPKLNMSPKAKTGTSSSELVDALRQLLDERRADSASDKSWNSRKGPAPGLKWRGGSPPQPPKWQYQSTDLRAYAKYERRVQVWQMQIQHYLTGAEAALMLFSSLSGEPEAEAEHMDLEKVNAKDGVSYILSCLKGPLEQKLLYQKRMLLSNYEGISRQGHETIRQFINRYKRVERDLQSVGISSAAMYDSESRGNRLLERCRLDPQLQRLVLIGAQSSLQFDNIVDSLNLQFPDFRPTPAVYQPGSWRQGGSSVSSNSHHKGSGKSWSSSTSTSASSTVPSSASAYNRGKGKGFPRKVFQTEHEPVEEAEHEEEVQEPLTEHGQEEEFFEPLEDEPDASPGDSAEAVDDDLGSSLSELASVLTVTSNKLRAATLGRKFTGRKSIEERKRTSTCSACGAVGHWSGDPECSISSKGGGKKKGKGKPAGGAPSSSGTSSYYPKKTFVVTYGDEQQDDPTDPSDTFYTFMTKSIDSEIVDTVDTSAFVFVAESIDLSGYMVLDTACQRSCAGTKWMQTHEKLLNNHGLVCHHEPCKDRFQFGAGSCQTALGRCYFPAAFAGQVTQGLVLGVSILDLPIPFLASRILLEQLGCIIDMSQNVLHMTKVGVSLPLRRRHGHIVAYINAFPTQVAKLSCWKELEHECFWDKPSPEVVVHPEAVISQSSTDVDIHAAYASHQASSRMAVGLEDHHPSGPLPGVQLPETDGSLGSAVSSPPVMVDLGGGAGAQRDASKGPHKAKGVSEALHASRVPEVRQCPRPIQPMQEVRSQVQMAPRARSMGGVLTKILQLLSAAVAFGSQHLGEGSLGHESSITQTGLQGQREKQDDSPSSLQPQDFFDVREQCQFDQQGTALRHDGTGLREFPADWAHQGGISRDDGDGQLGSIPRLRGSRRLPGGRLGLVNDPGQDGQDKDFWEKSKTKYIRHHITPRLLLFQLNPADCPVPTHLLVSECRAEVQYEDGTFETITYPWQSHQDTQLPKTWTGRTVFTVTSPSNHSMNLLTNAGRRALRTSIRQAHQVFSIEYAMVNQTVDEKPLNMHKIRASRSKVDVLETFAGSANISKRCGRFGLSAAQPIDFTTGWDLNKPADQLQLEQLIGKLKPLVLIEGIDCRDWTILQDNCNYVKRKILLLMRRAKARKLLKKICQWCRQQHQEGRLFVIENLITSRLWQEADIQSLLKLDGVMTTTCHSGAYGATNSRGQMIKKGFRFMGNCPHILHRLTRKLTPEQLHQCVPIEGRETRLSQVYPHEMVTQILQGIQQEVHQRYPDRDINRPQQHHQVWMTMAPEAWQEALQMAETTFQTTRYKSFVLPTSDPLFALTLRLTQWQHMERVQISLQPILWRFPWHIPHTHRAAALQYTDGGIEVIHEDLQELRHPRARFKKPVHIAIFMFGRAQDIPHTARPRGSQHQQATAEDAQDPLQGLPQDQQPPDGQPEDNPLRLVPLEEKEIQFASDAKISPEIKLALRRLHKNLGHPSTPELKKLLAMNGVRNQAVYSALDHMKCNSCERTRPLPRPVPGGQLQNEDGASQFGDRLQMDIIYVRDIKSTNYMMLGVIDEATHLHIGILLDNRTPEHVSEQFQLGWCRSFGYPLRLRTDPDGSFRSSFERDMEEAGVYMDYVPAEAHHKIGLIERHNHTYRTIMERIIDYHGITGRDQMQVVTAMTAYAKNSCTWSTGRPPYVAAFGRIPRQGINLLSDAHGLVTGHTQAQAQQFADSIRAEAQQQIAAMAIDSTFRRALLKNTAPDSGDIPEIGSTVAYWRWTAKSGRKRGGYKLARLLGRDPDGKSFWLQAGTNTVRVAPHQLRIARGFEQWNPDYDQIKQLRQASENLQENQIQDETIPEPPEDPEQPLGQDPIEPALDLPLSSLPFIVPATQPQPAAAAQPQTAAAEQAEEAVQTDPYQQAPQVEYHLNVNSPTYRQTVIHTGQNPFGMTPEQWMEPAVNVPVRKQHRSRTPRTKALEAGPTTPALEDKPASRTPSLAHPGTPLHGSQPGQAEATASAMQPRTTTSEVIDIESLPDNPLTQVAPSTPPELGGKRSSSEMTQPLPEQPSAYRALIAKHTRQLQIGDNSYHLQGYQKIARTSGNLNWFGPGETSPHMHCKPRTTLVRRRTGSGTAGYSLTHTAPSFGTSLMTMRMTTRSSAILQKTTSQSFGMSHSTQHTSAAWRSLQMAYS